MFIYKKKFVKQVLIVSCDQLLPNFITKIIRHPAIGFNMLIVTGQNDKSTFN